MVNRDWGGLMVDRRSWGVCSRGHWAVLGVSLVSDVTIHGTLDRKVVKRWEALTSRDKPQGGAE